MLSWNMDRQGVRIMKSIVLSVIAISAPLPAQWLNYPTPGIPRLPDGKPNLSAPTPRTADRKPDLSGVWELENPGQSQFINIAPSVQGGLPFRPGVADLMKARNADPKTDEPITRCLPVGVVIRHTWPGEVKKIVQNPGLLLILNEYNKSYRQIFTDGRPLPKDPQPAWDGYSTGKWDGDTLVVETTGFLDGQWLDTEGTPLTDAAKITERFRRANFGHLEVDVTVDDPKAYTKPWNVKVNFAFAADTDLLEFICLENEKDIKHMNAAAGVTK
jgi:hypothetical protein